jgi:hypothetical protein
VLNGIASPRAEFPNRFRLPNELELELIQTHMTQKTVLRVEVGKGRLCGLLSLGDSKASTASLL